MTKFTKEWFDKTIEEIFSAPRSRRQGFVMSMADVWPTTPDSGRGIRTEYRWCPSCGYLQFNYGTGWWHCGSFARISGNEYVGGHSWDSGCRPCIEQDNYRQDIPGPKSLG